MVRYQMHGAHGVRGCESGSDPKAIAYLVCQCSGRDQAPDQIKKYKNKEHNKTRYTRNNSTNCCAHPRRSVSATRQGTDNHHKHRTIANTTGPSGPPWRWTAGPTWCRCRYSVRAPEVPNGGALQVGHLGVRGVLRHHGHDHAHGSITTFHVPGTCGPAGSK